MRNLKKVLALVLALVMAMSLMVTAGATSLGDYKDSASVSPEYATAVDVATQLGILEGVGNNTYAPQGNLTRAQLATITYRIATGDVTDVYTDNFAGGAAASFTDTPADAWYAGYVGYAADAGYLKGVGEGLYKPNSTLTGYQTLAALLRVIGYNQPGQFTGPDWTVQVAQIATETGILNGLKNVDLNGPITREATALLIYNALFVENVSYTPARGYQPNGDTLAKEVFGIASLKAGVTDSIDVWGRPGTVWKNAKGEQVVIIAHEALASYTEAAKNCDIYADTDLKKDTVLDVYTNGAADGTYTIADNKNDSGEANQGRLTEVYADRVVNIDTYLASVDKVYAEKVDSKNHVTREAYVDLTVYAADSKVAGSYTYKTTELAAGDMVLVTIDADAGEVVSADAAKSAIGELTGLKGNIRVTGDIQNVLAVNGEDVTVNHTADYNCVMGLDEDYVFYYDTYGNIIGSEEVASQYVVIDSIWRETVKGETTVYADIVDFSANETEEVVVGNMRVHENKALNQERYYNVYEYVIEDGEYILKDADFRDFGAVTYEAGDTTLTPAPGSNNSRPVQLNDETVVLLQTAFSPDGEYTSYVGYKSLPDFMCSVMQVLDEDGDGYADLVYALGARISNRTIFIADINPVRTDVVDDGNRTVVTMEAYELVNGKLVETTFATTGWWNPEFNSWFADQIDTVGLYEITESDDGYTWFVNEAYPYENVYKTTDDGNRVMIGGEPGEYYVLDNAEIFKFEGTWETVEDVTYEDDWTKADLDDKSLIFIQEDEDGNVVAVYDMWIQQTVTVNGKPTSDIEYLGKTFKSVEVDLAEYEMIASATMAGGSKDDIVLDVTYYGLDGKPVVMDQDAGTKVDHAVVSYAGIVTGDVTITTRNQAAYTDPALNAGSYTFEGRNQAFCVENLETPTTYAGDKYTTYGNIVVYREGATVTGTDLKQAIGRLALGTNYQVVGEVMNTDAVVNNGEIAKDCFVLVKAWNGTDTAKYTISVIDEIN